MGIQLVGRTAELGAIIRSAEIGAHPHSISDDRHALVDFVQQLLAIAVIDIHNRNGFALSFLIRETGEQVQLRVEVVFHCPVKIEMVLGDRKSTRLNSSHSQISYAVFCLKKKNSSK